jgi:hypothetical protein
MQGVRADREDTEDEQLGRLKIAARRCGPDGERSRVRARPARSALVQSTKRLNRPDAISASSRTHSSLPGCSSIGRGGSGGAKRSYSAHNAGLAANSAGSSVSSLMGARLWITRRASPLRTTPHDDGTGESSSKPADPRSDNRRSVALAQTPCSRFAARRSARVGGTRSFSS